MKAIAFIALFALIATATARRAMWADSSDYQGEATCQTTYYDQQNDYYYYLGDLSDETENWLNATDNEGNVWYLNLCPDQDEEIDYPSPCPSGVSVCVLNATTGVITEKGSTNSQLLADSPFGSSMGVEATFGGEDAAGNAYKTVIEYVCLIEAQDLIASASSEDTTTTDYEMAPVYVSVNVMDSTYTVITVNTTQACGQPDMVMDGNMDIAEWDDDDYDNDFNWYLPFNPLFCIVFAVSFLATCICCCCCVRRRRCQMKKAVAMKQFSNVAFQPIPQTQAKAPVQQQQFAPAFNPYIAQPQFVYYYPAQGQFVPPQTQLDEQIMADEKYAQELQAEFMRQNV